jgi:hypothetical protein
MPILLLVFAVIAALFAYPASQAPEFKTQYTQRIGGAVDELRIIVRNFQEDASRFGMNLTEAIDRLKKNSDSFVQAQGIRMEQNIFRLERLQSQKVKLEGSSAIDGLITLALHYDPQLLNRTRESYRQAWTEEGLLFGGFVFLLIFFGLATLASMLSGKHQSVEA